MRLPKMVLFDYGQTLVAEEKFDGVKGTRAVLQYATKNKYNMSAEEVQEHANRINTELGRLPSLYLRREIAGTPFSFVPLHFFKSSPT